MTGAPLPRAGDSVITWYRQHGRDLPWRGAEPWPVLVSEVMLQQTPVKRVLPVFDEWLARWPTPAALSAATLADVLTAWGRLGYPRRARNLQRAATQLVDAHGGRVPSDLESLEALPGIGEYSARAIAVFAFGRRHPVVDVNVRRVLARWQEGLAGAAPSVRFLHRAEALLPEHPEDAAAFSAGLMELGALVCTSRAPDCRSCPLARSCAWRKDGCPQAPPRRPRTRYEGSDRQARGHLLDVLRKGGSLDGSSARRAVPDQEQRRRALGGLERDGLVVREGRSWRFP